MSHIAVPSALPNGRQARRVMQATRSNQLAYPDSWLVGALAMLLGLGIVMVYSTTIAGSNGVLGGSYTDLLKHCLHLCIGLSLLFGASKISITWLQLHAFKFLLLGIVLLIAVLLPGIGKSVNGSTRWLAFAGFGIQPSEFVKVFMIIYTADYITRKQNVLHQFRDGILNVALVVTVLGILLLMEPDFGSTAVITATVMAMLFLGGVRIWHFLLCGIAVAGLLSLLTVLSPYRLARVMTFLNPWSDPFDSGFQLTQALIAFGRGEWFGVGLGASIQKLFYLPFSSTDFMVAVIGEELGFVGIFILLSLFGILLWRGFALARRAEVLQKPFAARLAQGIVLLIVLQAGINIGVNMGVLPTKGLTLPFLSYGGSSLLANLTAMGLLFAIDRSCRVKPTSRSGATQNSSSEGRHRPRQKVRNKSKAKSPTMA